MINAACISEATGSNGLEYTKNAGGINVCREFRGIKAHLDVALSCQIVYFVWLDLGDDLHDRHGIAEVGIVEMEVLFAFEVGYALAVVYAAAANDAMHVIALFQKKFTQIGAILSCDTCY